MLRCNTQNGSESVNSIIMGMNPCIDSLRLVLLGKMGSAVRRSTERYNTKPRDLIECLAVSDPQPTVRDAVLEKRPVQQRDGPLDCVKLPPVISIEFSDRIGKKVATIRTILSCC